MAWWLLNMSCALLIMIWMFSCLVLVGEWLMAALIHGNKKSYPVGLRQFETRAHLRQTYGRLLVIDILVVATTLFCTVMMVQPFIQLNEMTDNVANWDLYGATVTLFILKQYHHYTYEQALTEYQSHVK
ncbi:hypothetical protein [Lactiplantibacillus fabifermentans]|uniref:Uncharacterized protein n=2 Tax=Lactiplantibacillus fabifermentans TaxID=483011 RepID=A0A0R2NUS8_9LACO|nr:hypothetical protein [Lactiplantibacillus fabifermentans]KRO29513.1 hypothetical protein DY78_GL002901 [Lactiplantibacillus fabifermentans DSM 21115]